MNPSRVLCNRALQRGYRWSDVPGEYGPAKTLYNRYKRWSEAGVFAQIFEALARDGADTSVLMIDARHVKTLRIAANGVKKTLAKTAPSARPKAGLNSKLHLVCDGEGRPLSITLTAGNRVDISQARQCFEPLVRKGATVIADRGSRI